MSEQAAPVPHADGTEGRHSAAPGPGTSAAPGPGTSAAPVPPGTSAAPVPPGTVPPSAALVPVTMPERTALAVRRAGNAVMRTIRELWLHPDRLLYVMWHGKPDSFAGHFTYMRSKAWVPEGMTGRPAKFLIAAGFAYHVLIAWPLIVLAGLIGGAAVRPLRLLCLAAFVIPVLFILGII